MLKIILKINKLVVLNAFLWPILCLAVTSLIVTTGRLKSAPSGASPALAGCHRPDWGRTKSQVLRNIWETVTAQHQVDIFLKIKIQPPKSESREFSISWMWNWSECNYFTLFSAVWLWTKHQLMHKQDLLTPILTFSIKDVKQIYWPSLNGFQQSQPPPRQAQLHFPVVT